MQNETITINNSTIWFLYRHKRYHYGSSVVSEKLIGLIGVQYKPQYQRTATNSRNSTVYRSYNKKPEINEANNKATEKTVMVFLLTKNQLMAKQ